MNKRSILYFFLVSVVPVDPVTGVVATETVVDNQRAISITWNVSGNGTESESDVTVK